MAHEGHAQCRGIITFQRFSTCFCALLIVDETDIHCIKALTINIYLDKLYTLKTRMDFSRQEDR